MKRNDEDMMKYNDEIKDEYIWWKLKHYDDDKNMMNNEEWKIYMI